MKITIFSRNKKVNEKRVQICAAHMLEGSCVLMSASVSGLLRLSSWLKDMMKSQLTYRSWKRRTLWVPPKGLRPPGVLSPYFGNS